MNKIRRLNETKLAGLLSPDAPRDVILVQGARQVGKTTLVQRVLEPLSDILTLNLERDLDALRGIDRTESFADFTRYLQTFFRTTDLDREGRMLFIDEAQESERLGRYVRFMKEEWRHIRVILSGSSMSRLFRKDTRVPVGRVRPWLVTPLTFEEFLSGASYAHLVNVFQDFAHTPRPGLIDGSLHRAFLAVLDDYLTVGGLPAVVTEFWAHGDYKALRRALYDSQEDDFVRKSQLTDRSLFARGLRGVANFVGMPSKFTHIYDAKGVAEQLLSTLVAWHLVLEIEQKSAASTSQHLPKRYLYDIGIAQDLRDMPFPKLSLVSTQNPALRTQLGGLFENALLLSLVSDQARLGDISGWRKGGTDSPEVDFVWRHDDVLIALECKATQKLSLKHWSSLKQYLEHVQDAGVLSVGVLVSAAPFEVIRGRKGTLLNIPLYLASGTIIRRCVQLYAREAAHG